VPGPQRFQPITINRIEVPEFQLESITKPGDIHRGSSGKTLMGSTEAHRVYGDVSLGTR
jgi:hypothetical protein